MRLYLINPSNSLINLANVKASRWNRYRIWKPLGLLVLAGLTPKDWEITVVDENLGIPDYETMPQPDLVGITAFTSQANRAYELAAQFRARAVPVVMGGIHATMRREEALQYVDAVVTGEAESVWAQVLDDARAGRLQPTYPGHHVDMAEIPTARHDLLDKGYAFGSIQTTRGCPLNCTFCSVSTFNGNQYRNRPIDRVLEEMRTIREEWILIVDDNLIGTAPAHFERAKTLFRAMIREMLFLANAGADVLRFDAVAFMWKEKGTRCESLPKVHTLIKAFKKAAGLAVPQLIFKSEAIVHPDEVLQYIRADECELSYNPLLMAELWEAAAVRNPVLRGGLRVG